jgi:hypothetical protein
MDMKHRILTAAILATPWVPIIKAADSQLLNLVMPDAKILAGVNVDQAKTSLFGQYLITQIEAQNPHFQQFVTETGFDPTQDLDELLCASNGAATNPSHLTLARGTFNTSKIDAAASAAGATSEVYNGVTILENPKHASGFAFLSSTLAVAGDIASVKGAIDRQTAPSTLPASLVVEVNQLSTSEDAWGISQGPPPTIKPPANMPNVSTNIFQNIQQASGGVNFGSQVVINAQLVADTAQDATTLANMIEFLVNLGEIQTQQNANASAALKAVVIATSGSTINVMASIPVAQLEALVELKFNKQAPSDVRHPQSQEQQRF